MVHQKHVNRTIVCQHGSCRCRWPLVVSTEHKASPLLATDCKTWPCCKVKALITIKELGPYLGSPGYVHCVFGRVSV